MAHVNYAAQTLKLALDKWATSVNQLRLQTHKALKEVLSDPKRTLPSQFGALSALTVLGPKVLVQCVLPHMDRILSGLDMKKLDNNGVMTNGHFPGQNLRYQEKQDLMLMHCTFLAAARSMLNYFSVAKNGEKLAEMYAIFSKHFGDELSMANLAKFHDESFPETDVAGRLKIRCFFKCMDKNFVEPQRFPNELNDIFDDPFGTHNGIMDIDNDDSALKIVSNSVRNQFECVKINVLKVNPKIRFNVRALNAWPEERLKKKIIGEKSKFTNKNLSGFVGKRLGHPLSRSERKRKLALLTGNFETSVL